MKKIILIMGIAGMFSINSNICYATNVENINVLDDIKTYITLENIEDSKSVLELKESIEDKTNISKDEMEIYLDEVKLDNSKSILESKIKSNSNLKLEISKWNNLEIVKDNLNKQIKDIYINSDKLYMLQGSEVYLDGKKIISDLAVTINNIYVSDKYIYLFEPQNILKYNIDTYEKVETISASTIEPSASILDIIEVEDKLVYLYNAGTLDTYIYQNDVKTKIDSNMNMFSSLKYDNVLDKLYYITDNNIYNINKDNTKTLLKNIGEYILDCSIESENIYLITTDGTSMYFKDLNADKNINEFELEDKYTSVEYISLASNEEGVYVSGSLGIENILGIFPYIKEDKKLSNKDIEICATMISNTKLEVEDLGNNEYNINCIRNSNKSYIKLEDCILTFNNLKGTGKVKVIGEDVSEVLNIKNGSVSLKVDKLGKYKIEYIEEVLVNPATGKTNYAKEAVTYFFELIKNILDKD